MTKENIETQDHLKWYKRRHVPGCEHLEDETEAAVKEARKCKQLYLECKKAADKGELELAKKKAEEFKEIGKKIDAHQAAVKKEVRRMRDRHRNNCEKARLERERKKAEEEKVIED